MSWAERVRLEAAVLRWANAALEAGVLFVLLATWLQPTDRSVASPALLATASLLLAKLARRLLLFMGGPETPRVLASALVGLAWSVTAARLCAPPGYWESGEPRLWVVFGAVLGGRDSAGSQPIVFWSSALIWWRGSALTGWEPTLEDLFAKLRLGAGLVLLAAAFGPSGGAAQGGLLLGCGVFAVAALAASSVARRLETAPALDEQPADRPLRTRRGGALAPLLALALAGAVLGLAFAGAGWLGPDTATPVLAAVGRGFEALAAGAAALLTWLGGLLPQLALPAPVAEPAATPQPGQDWTPVHLPEPPAWVLWLGLATMGLLALAFTVYVIGTVRRMARIEWELPGLDFPALGKSEPPPIVAARAAVARAGGLWAWLRGLLLRRPGTRMSSPCPPADATAVRLRRTSRGVRAQYRAYLRLARERGIARRVDETAAELARRIASSWPAAGRPARQLTEVYQAVRYGPRAPTGTDEATSERALRALRAAPPPAQGGPGSEETEPAAPPLA